jgi:hypothetical protein
VSRRALTAASLVLLLAGCNGASGGGNAADGANVQTANVVTSGNEQLPAGTTPLRERIAVLGFLNKRNGISQELTLKPGQAVRIKDAVVRVGACETTPPWEFDKLTGAFVQLDVQQPSGTWKRIFSGWLYKESPSLNVVEHPVYDVWVKNCVMNFPEGPSSPATPAASSNASSAAKSPSRGTAAAEPSADEPADDAPVTDTPTAADSNAT